MTQLKNFGRFCPKGLPSVANSSNSESFLVQIPTFGFVAAVEKTAAVMAAGASQWFEKLKKLELLQLLQLLFGRICNVYGSKCEKPRKLQKRKQVLCQKCQ